MARPQERKTENAVIKASAAIQINGRITLLQRRAWNVLLANAYDELPHKDRHSIPIANLMRTLEFASKNDDYLKEAITSLIHCSVEWNILEKDGETEWGVAALLAGAKIARGICTYTYEPMLREKLYNPRMYARLSLLVQNRFASKHALTLWELCVDYLGAKRDCGETPWIAIDDFRKIMGIEDNHYYATLFKKLKQKVVTPALAEVNRVSDFSVTIEYQHKGRKVTALKFTMRRVVVLPDPATLPPPQASATNGLPAVVLALQEAGLAPQEAMDIWRQGFAVVAEDVRPHSAPDDADVAFTHYIQEKIHLLHRRQAAGKVEHTTGFLREAIRKNYANPEYAAAQQREAQRVQQQVAAALEPQRQALAQQHAAVEARREEALQTLCGTLVAEQPEVLEQAVAWALQEVPGFHGFYQRDNTALDNYRGRITIRAVLDPYVERQAPERFAAVRERYAAELAALDRQRRALQP
jgi:hypothetical protein